MSYRMVLPRRSAAHSLAARGEMHLALTGALEALPARPALLDACVTQLSAVGRSEDFNVLALRGLSTLRQALLGAAGGTDSHLAILWRCALATAHYSARLARGMTLDVRVAATAGLLHRAGDLRVLAVLCDVEQAQGMRLDGPSRAGVCAEYGAQQAQQLVAAWRLPPAVGFAVVGWRNAPGRRSAPTEATSVYVGHLLATQFEEPQFAAPGLLEAATNELKIAPAVLTDALAADAALKQLLQQAG
jgi:hypothetical protein